MYPELAASIRFEMVVRICFLFLALASLLRPLKAISLARNQAVVAGSCLESRRSTSRGPPALSSQRSIEQ